MCLLHVLLVAAKLQLCYHTELNKMIDLQILTAGLVDLNCKNGCTGHSEEGLRKLCIRWPIRSTKVVTVSTAYKYLDQNFSKCGKTMAEVLFSAYNV